MLIYDEPRLIKISHTGINYGSYMRNLIPYFFGYIHFNKTYIENIKTLIQ